ncbi:MAG: response regulator [Verrucomicrobia bacterium]|nr:response regulator [Verrucomicrobiota bacterium]
MNVKSILLVEDDPRDVELTLAALEDQNLADKVEVVHNGAEALDYLYRQGKFKTRPEGSPVVIFLDNKMPKVSGLEVLKSIKSDEHLRMVPVVVLTSSRETPDLVEFYQQGVNAYVVKPVDFGDFMSAVQQLGVFWADVNEAPFASWRDEIKGGNGTNVLCGKKELNDEIPPHSVSGG